MIDQEPINVSEYKRRMRAVSDELMLSPVRLEKSGAEPTKNEFARAVDCLRRHGIVLGDDARLTWSPYQNSWVIE